MSAKKKWYIGTSSCGREYLEDFTWDCGWYWGGGYLGNSRLHHHVRGIAQKENVNLFDALKAYYDKDLVLSDDDLWRFCDLFRQFYVYKDAAECFQYGGHYTNRGRTAAEINTEMAATINKHIGEVIIPEIQKIMDSYN